MGDLSLAVILLAFVLGTLVISVVVLLLVGARRQSKKTKLKEVAAKLQQDAKFREADVVVDVVNSVRVGPVAWGATASDEPHTRLRVTHQGRMPCAILAKRRGLWDRDTRQIGMLSVRFMDIRAFEAAKKQGVHDLDLPQKVYIGGKKVSTALEKDILPRCIEFAESVFDVEVQKAVTGLPFTNIMVEPTVVSFIIEGYVLDEKALRRMADFLLLLSEKVHKATVS